MSQIFKMASAVCIGLIVLLTSTTIGHANGVREGQIVEKSTYDSALVTGVLPNGMRYYVRVNPIPAKRASLWLAVNAGSAAEDEDQLGFAHFVEHMAFNGTESFPGNEVVHFVERAGMSFGMDLNAYTSFDETVYMLTVPTDSPALLQQGIQILQDWAGQRILMDSAEIVAERGVIMGEWRTRLMDTISMKEYTRMMSTLYGDSSAYVTRFPIGDPGLIMSATPEPLKRFYKDWYRPDLMAIIAVGDFDKDEMVREIHERFGQIPMPDNPRPYVAPGMPDREMPFINVYSGRVKQQGLTALWLQKDYPQDVTSAFTQILTERLLVEGLQKRLLDLQRSAQPPFFSARLVEGVASRALGRIFLLSIQAKPENFLSAYATVLTELEKYVQEATSVHDFELQKQRLLNRLEKEAARESAGAAVSTSSQLARYYSESYLTGSGVLIGPREALELARSILPEITQETIAKSAKFWHDKQSLIVNIDWNEWNAAERPDSDRVLAVMDSVRGMKLEGDSLASDNNVAASASDSLVLGDREIKPGSITSEKRYNNSEVIEWHLSNGARVLYKHTEYNPDELLIVAYSLGGSSLLPDTLFFSAGRLVGPIFTDIAGFGELSKSDLERDRSDDLLRNFRVTLNYGDESILMGGSPVNSEELFNLLHLQFTEPRLDSSMLEEWKRYGFESVWAEYKRNTNDQVARQLSGGNKRFAPIDPGLIDFATVDKVMAVYNHRFGDAGDFTFAIVGAVPPEVARPLVEKYIASLPSLNRATREVPVEARIRPLDRVIKRKNKNERLPRAHTMVVFDGPFPSEPDEYIAAQEKLATVRWILNRRLREDMRESRGSTYGVAFQTGNYFAPQLRYQVSAQFTSDPTEIDTLNSVFLYHLDSVRKFGVTEAELSMARASQYRSTETALMTNNYWLNTMLMYDKIGIDMDRIVSPFKYDFSREQLRETANRFMPASAYMMNTVVPGAKALTVDYFLKDRKEAAEEKGSEEE